MHVIDLLTISNGFGMMIGAVFVIFNEW